MSTSFPATNIPILYWLQRIYSPRQQRQQPCQDLQGLSPCQGPQGLQPLAHHLHTTLSVSFKLQSVKKIVRKIFCFEDIAYKVVSNILSRETFLWFLKLSFIV